MASDQDTGQIKDYFEEKFDRHGPTPQGVDWNSEQAQNIRFDQLVKVCNLSRPFSLIDYGCGYGALAGYLMGKGFKFQYTGYDLSQEMVSKAQVIYQGVKNCRFTHQESDLATAEYTLASGIFNKKFETSEDEWLAYILRTLEKINVLSSAGFAFNLLTQYSDPKLLKPDLYYGDPCFFFTYCKQHFARNVALLHDYEVYDFTVIVRKS
jgi:SAM-dependent methyltransferase